MNCWFCHFNNICTIFSSFSLCVVSQNVAKCVPGRCRTLLYINNIYIYLFIYLSITSVHCLYYCYVIYRQVFLGFPVSISKC